MAMMLTKRVETRLQWDCPIFGYPKVLSDTYLPTYDDVMKFYLYVRHELKPDISSKEPKVSEILDIVMEKVENVWVKASITTVSRTRMLQMGKAYHDKYRNILRSKGRKGTEHYDLAVEKFLNDSKRLFDVASCKCKLFSECKCKKDKKVPVLEQEFLVDQRTNRKMCISTLDKSVTKILNQREERKSKVIRQELKYKQHLEAEVGNITQNAVLLQSDDSDDELPVTLTNMTGIDVLQPEDYDDEFLAKSIDNAKPSTCSQAITKNMLNLPTVAAICDRTGVSDRVAAAIASAVLKDVGIISEENKTKVIDRMKIRRARASNRKRAVAASVNNQVGANKGLFFDGRKDKTIAKEKKGNKFYKKTIVEEHISLVGEPGSFFLAHVAPASGTGESIKDSIVEYFNNNGDLNLNGITAIGCDGTATNTGAKKGVIALLEKNLQKPLQWLICLFHCNELPLRHLFCALDGKTKGPNEFGGVIGKLLENCHELLVVTYSPIKDNLPDLEIKQDLSTDQKYLLEMCKSISSGICLPDLAMKKPGKLAHSRWLTLANRILRLYVGTESPSENLKTLTEYVVKVYAPIWFYIKLKPSCVDGAKHLWRLIMFSRYLCDEYLKIIDPVIQRNNYYAHPENMLLCMLTDERKHIRELALRRLLKARSEQKNEVRKFVTPKLNFKAEDYIDMIDWADVTITEPPMTKHVTDEDLAKYICEARQNSLMHSIDFPRFPCHTQAVERVIKLVTESSLCVCGLEERNGFVKARIASHKMMPKFETKKHFT